MNSSSYNFFTNFANKTRFKIISALKQKPMSVTEIKNAINEEQSTTSHNLKKLLHCGIIKVEKKGKQRIYSVNQKTVMPMLNLVNKHIKTNCMKCENASKKNIYG